MLESSSQIRRQITLAIKGENKSCPVCGVVYYRYPSQIKSGRNITCSRTCAARYFRDTGTTANCRRCGKEFYRRVSLAEKGYANYCSKPCQAADRSLKVECCCVQCGKTFLKDQWSVNVLGSGGHFCSRKCIDIFKRRLRKRGEQEMFTNWQKHEWMTASCVRCDATENLELDHVIPRFAGGKATRENAQTLCGSCNRKKFWTDDYDLYEQALKQRVG